MLSNVLLQVCQEQSQRLDNLATVMMQYSRQSFTKGAFQWTKCVVHHLYAVYNSLSDQMIAFLVEVTYLLVLLSLSFTGYVGARVKVKVTSEAVCESHYGNSYVIWDVCGETGYCFVLTSKTVKVVHLLKQAM